MNIELSKKIIEDRCGSVSYKRGDAIRRSNKVKFEEYRDDGCRAMVQSTEEFSVSINAIPEGGFQAECSCPKLVSFNRDCQHIAAVLLALKDYQSSKTIPELQYEIPSAPYDGLAEGLLRVFHSRPIQQAAELNYFEQRKVLNASFHLQPALAEKDAFLFQIKIKMHSIEIQNIRAFLEQVKGGHAIPLSSSFTYDPRLHCFPKETDAVIRQLVHIMENEKLDQHDGAALILSPFEWDSLLTLLAAAHLVELKVKGKNYKDFHVSDKRLPLRFDFFEEGKGFQLKTDGLRSLTLLQPYHSALFEGKLFQLNGEDYARLAELCRVNKASGRDVISIPPDQMNVYLDKVVPGLRRLGEVTISEAISRQKADAKFMAKLYLDRIKNRMLAGLEFHYGNIVFNPLDEREVQSLTMLIRDTEKEEIILKLMEESSFAKTDSGYFLQNELLEYEFLYHVLPVLERFAQVHATTAIRTRIFKEHHAPKIRVLVKRERTNWLEFKFDLDIPEKEIREVLQALQEKRKYYRLRSGALLSLETREYKEIQRFLAAAPVQEEDLLKELEMPYIQGLQLLDSAETDSIMLEESFHQLLNSFLHPNELAFPVPKKLEPVLREYQKNGYKWMKSLAENGFGGILADDMGLGKTVQSIAYILSELPVIRASKKPVLIVCPSSLLYNWKNEIQKFTPEVKALIIDGSKKERTESFEDSGSMDVIITSYPLVRKDIQEYEKQFFHTVFFDEAQAFKNPLTQTARAVKKMMADHRFALTGTPVENAREELWSIYHVVFPELFLGLKEFSSLSRKQIARRIRPFMLRRMKEDVLSELPEKIESMEIVELLPEQKKLYTAYLAKLRHDTLKHLDKDTLQKNRIKILAGLTRLRQICCHPALFVDGYSGRSAKFDQLMLILEEAKLSGRRVLIFSQFTKMLELIGRELAVQSLPYFYLAGQTHLEERVELCSRFNAGERNLFLISLKAGGTGLNLTGADTVIHYDTWWNPAVEDQAADRAHRMGQKNAVNVIKLVTRGTIEEKMNELQEKKRLLIKEVIDYNEKTDFSLTEEDIKDLLRI
ncbi:SNF2 helicase associated domain-containing protein [Metabacillus sp. RGM 3146]|uniref:DEAD/DEAH box helicase n=1 Tax=Metabacillus sp. RGM 3146 TaxID=3401092 RepID=UPI003B9BF544